MKRPAFTIIELLISMSVMALLFGIGVAKYVSFNQSQTLKQAGQKLRNELRVAANKAITGEKPGGGCTYLEGYEFRASSLSYSYLGKCNGGSVYGPAVSINLPSGISLSPSGTIILFKVLGQGVDSGSTLTLSGFGKTETITINISGEIQ